MTVRVAAVDCGTNSLRLLIADADPATGRLTDVLRRSGIVRLGEGVDASGEISPRAMARTLDLAAEYARLCTGAGVQRVRFVATSATRDARNAGTFTAAVRSLFGTGPEVITGAEEARLSYAGAARSLGAGAGDPVLVVDLGGGSTEFVLGTGGQVEAAISVDVGSVRLTERYLRSDPPSGAELAAARRDVTGALEQVAAVVPLERTRVLVGVAGTVTTVAAHALGLPGYDAPAFEGRPLPVATVRAACTELFSSSRDARARLPYLPAGRADVIAAGALIWDAVVGKVVSAAGLRSVIASEHDILDGIAWSLGGCGVG